MKNSLCLTCLLLSLTGCLGEHKSQDTTPQNNTSQTGRPAGTLVASPTTSNMTQASTSPGTSATTTTPTSGPVMTMTPSTNQPNTDFCAPIPQRLWKLSPLQLAATADAIVPGGGKFALETASSLPSLAKSFDTLAKQQVANEPHLEQLFGMAEQIATLAKSKPGRIESCLGKTPDETSCQKAVIAKLGPIAWRRPLSDKERAKLLSLWESESTRAQDPLEGFGVMLTALLLSPNFLYRTEVGQGDGEVATMNDFEIASALSFFITNSPPDQLLIDAASQGMLQDPEERRIHARRLLKTPEVAQGITMFLEQWLGYRTVADSQKSKKLFPEFKDNIKQAMVEETRLTLEYVLWEDDARFETLLNAPYTFVNEPLAQFYGLSYPDGAKGFVKVPWPKEMRRRGVLSQGSIQAYLSEETHTAPVFRGLFIREHLLCGHLPPPPPTVNAFTVVDPAKTMKANLLAQTDKKECLGCHNLMNDLGLATEHIDPVGRWRETETLYTDDTYKEVLRQAPIDTAGIVHHWIDPDKNTPFQDGQDLMTQLAALPEARECMVAQTFRWGHGREETKEDACHMQALVQAFEKSDGNMMELFVELVAQDLFYQRSTRTQ